MGVGVGAGASGSSNSSSSSSSSRWSYDESSSRSSQGPFAQEFGVRNGFSMDSRLHEAFKRLIPKSRQDAGGLVSAAPEGPKTELPISARLRVVPDGGRGVTPSRNQFACSLRLLLPKCGSLNKALLFFWSSCSLIRSEVVWAAACTGLQNPFEVSAESVPEAAATRRP